MASIELPFDDFQLVLEFDPSEKNYALACADENAKRINEVAIQLFGYLQTFTASSDIIQTFIHKMRAIQAQFEEEGLRSSFEDSITLVTLAFASQHLGLHPRLQKILRESFLIEYIKGPNQKETTKQGTFLQNSTKLIEKYLTPLLREKLHHSDVKVLHMLLQKGYFLAKASGYEPLKEAVATAANLLRFQNCVTAKAYHNLLHYKEGDLSGLDNEQKRKQVIERLDRFLDKFISSLKEEAAFDLVEIQKIYNHLLLIQKEFSKYNETFLNKHLKHLKAFLQSQGCTISKNRSSSSSFQRVLDLWHQKSNNTSAKTVSLEKKPVREKIVRERKPMDFHEIQDGIDHLDLSDPKLSEKIAEIKRNIDLLKIAAPEKEESLNIIRQTINLFTDDKLLKGSEVESFLVELLSKQGFNIDPEKYLKFAKSSILEVRRHLLCQIKGSSSLKDLCARIPTRSNLKAMAIQARVKLSGETGARFQENFPILIRAFEYFSQNVALRFYSSKWEKIQKLFDESSKRQFSSVVSRYGYLDLSEYFPKLIELAQKLFSESLDLKKISHLPTQEFRSYITQKLKSSKPVPPVVFDEIYQEGFMDKHMWILDNIENLKVLYDQGKEHDTNLGEGVCVENSFQRQTALLDNPILESHQLQMGSDPKTRFFKARSRSHFEQMQSLKRFGLSLKDEITVSEGLNGGLYKAVMDQIERLAKEGKSQVILWLYQENSAHAMNIQVDMNRSIFRVMDDNLGVSEYASFEEFRKHITQFLKVFYPDVTFFELQQFERRRS